jgi:hypothetical protein
VTRIDAGRRLKVLRRDGFHCVYCGEEFPPEDLTLDHVEPRMRGGDQSDGNLVACCGECNRLKGGQPAWSFLSTRPEMRLNFLAAVQAAHALQGEAGSGIAGPVWPRLVRAIEEAASRSERERRRQN